jgi:hypothetical protein
MVVIPNSATGALTQTITIAVQTAAQPDYKARRAESPASVPEGPDQPESPHTELADIERFLYELIRTASEAAGESFVAPVCGQNQNGNTFVARCFAKRAQDLKSMKTGHFEIEDQQIERPLPQARQRIRASHDYLGMHVIRSERRSHQRRNIGIVIGNQHRRRLQIKLQVIGRDDGSLRIGHCRFCLHRLGEVSFHEHLSARIARHFSANREKFRFENPKQ